VSASALTRLFRNGPVRYASAFRLFEGAGHPLSRSGTWENATKTQLLANGPDEDDRERLRRRIYVYHACGTIFGRTNDTS